MIYLKQPIGNILTPSFLVYANLLPVTTAKKLGSLIFRLFSAIFFFIKLSSFSKCFAPSSIFVDPNLNSINAYLPSFKCNTQSASRLYLS